MIIVCESMLTHVEVCVPTKGSGGIPPQENFEFRSSKALTSLVKALAGVPASVDYCVTTYLGKTTA